MNEDFEDSGDFQKHITNISILSKLALTQQQTQMIHKYVAATVIIQIDDIAKTIYGSIFGNSFNDFDDGIMKITDLPPSQYELGYLLTVDVLLNENTNKHILEDVELLLQAILDKYTQFVEIKFVDKLHLSCNYETTKTADLQDELILLILLSRLQSESIRTISGLHLCELIRIYPNHNNLIRTFTKTLYQFRCLGLLKPCTEKFSLGGTKNQVECYKAISMLLYGRHGASLFLMQKDTTFSAFDVRLFLIELRRAYIRIGHDFQYRKGAIFNYESEAPYSSIVATISQCILEKGDHSKIHKSESHDAKTIRLHSLLSNPVFMNALRMPSVVSDLRRGTIPHMIRSIVSPNTLNMLLSNGIISEEKISILLDKERTFCSYLYKLSLEKLTSVELLFNEDSEDVLLCTTLTKLKLSNILVRLKLNFQISMYFDPIYKMIKKVICKGPQRIKYLSIKGLPLFNGSNFQGNFKAAYPNVQVIHLEFAERPEQVHYFEKSKFYSNEELYLDPNYFIGFENLEVIITTCRRKNNLNLPPNIRAIEFICCKHCNDNTVFTEPTSSQACQFHNLQSFTATIKIVKDFHKFATHNSNLFLKCEDDLEFYLKAKQSLESLML